MKCVVLIVLVMVMNIDMQGQDAYQQYQLGPAHFSMPISMQPDDAGRSDLRMFSSDVRSEGASIIISYLEKDKRTLTASFDQLMKVHLVSREEAAPGNLSCSVVGDIVNKKIGTSAYRACEIQCVAGDGDMTVVQYNYIASIETPTGTFTYIAECPLELKDKYRPVFRKVLHSLREE